MIVLHAAPLTWTHLAGPNASVPALVAAQNSLAGVSAALLTTAAGQPPPSPFPVFDVGSVCRRTGRPILPEPFARPDLVVFHSTYIPLHGKIARYLRRVSIPYLICPRGGMTRYARASKRWKKTAGGFLFFNRLVRGAAALHCLTEGEADASRDWNKPALVVGNGVDLPEPIPPRTLVDRPLRLVFMGRLHIDHKGLDLLVDACRAVKQRLSAAAATVEIYGPDCDGSSGALRRRIAQTGTDHVVSLRGPVTGREKSDLLFSTDVFLHPSRTEAHPIAVLEALAHGTPCLLTPPTNLGKQVAGTGAGWEVEATVEGVAGGLRKILELTAMERLAAGRNARRLAETAYRWTLVADQSIRAYRRFAA